MMWIKSSVDIRNHPKVYRFAHILGISLPEAIGYLHLFWGWVISYHANGELETLQELDIAPATMWQGDPKTFIDALIQAGFIDKTKSGYVVHNWREHYGKLKRIRDMSAERSKRYRERHAFVTQQEDSSSRNREEKNKDKSKEEKNREEKKKNISDLFDEFWSLYPRHDGRTPARKVFEKLIDRGVRVDELLSAASGYARATVGTEKKYIKLASTFLGPQDPWMDYVDYVSSDDDERTPEYTEGNDDQKAYSAAREAWLKKARSVGFMGNMDSPTEIEAYHAKGYISDEMRDEALRLQEWLRRLE